MELKLSQFETMELFMIRDEFLFLSDGAGHFKKVAYAMTMKLKFPLRARLLSLY